MRKNKGILIRGFCGYFSPWLEYRLTGLRFGLPGEAPGQFDSGGGQQSRAQFGRVHSPLSSFRTFNWVMHRPDNPRSPLFDGGVEALPGLLQVTRDPVRRPDRHRVDPAGTSGSGAVVPVPDRAHELDGGGVLPGSVSAVLRVRLEPRNSGTVPFGADPSRRALIRDEVPFRLGPDRSRTRRTGRTGPVTLDDRNRLWRKRHPQSPPCPARPQTDAAAVGPDALPRARTTAEDSRSGLRHGTPCSPGSLTDYEYDYKDTVASNGLIDRRDRTRIDLAVSAATNRVTGWTYDGVGNQM